jgi:hypothetical protein
VFVWDRGPAGLDKNPSERYIDRHNRRYAA